MPCPTAPTCSCLPHACVQVYNEQIYDLLDEQGVGPLGQRGALKLKEDALGRVFVAGLSEVRWPPAPPIPRLGVAGSAPGGDRQLPAAEQE